MQKRTEVQAEVQQGHLRAKSGVFRGVVSAALLSVMLGACSSVPDVVNPVSWYEKTTDFFSGDSQAADTTTLTADGQVAQNQGLAADPNAPPPAPSPVPSQAVNTAPSGLSADQVASNYASPAIERQGAPSNVLTPQAQVAQAPQVTPPAPVAAPRPAMAVAPAPAPKTAPTTMASAPPPMPTMPSASGAPAPASVPTSAPLAVSEAPTGPMTPPPPFEFPAPSAMAGYGGEFETVVISADGMAPAVAEPAAMPQLSMAGAPTAASQSTGALFPEPGATTTGTVGPATVGGMVRVATIHFANNAANLDRRDRSILGAVIQLQKERGGRVVVVGHASARTKDMDYIKHQMVNFEISMNRAGAIGTALKTMGLPAETLEVQAVSDTQPLFLEVMPSGEAGNRRVEIYLAAAAT